MLTGIVKKAVLASSIMVDVFTTTPRLGNPAVVIKGFTGTPVEMQSISRKIQAPVTVFTTDAEPYTLRFFTPTTELPMCGHGAVAAAYSLFRENPHNDMIEAQTSSEQKLLLRRNKEDYQLEMQRAQIIPLPSLQDGSLSRMLGENYGDIKSTDLNVHAATVGSPKLLVPVKSLKDLKALKPNFQEILTWSERNKINGIYVYTTETTDPLSHIHARSFNPKSGQNEDVATGVAAAALGCVLYEKYKFLDELIIEQGDILGKPCRLSVQIREHSVSVGGGVVFRKDIDLGEILK